MSNNKEHIHPFVHEKTEQAEAVVFVYGTLKKGFGNHRLLAHAKFMGQAVTSEAYALYISSIPFVIRKEQVSCIHGEVYQVDRATLASLDSLEGHPGWYKREKITVSLREKQSERKMITAWIYFYPNPTGRLQNDGNYR